MYEPEGQEKLNSVSRASPATAILLSTVVHDCVLHTIFSDKGGHIVPPLAG